MDHPSAICFVYSVYMYRASYLRQNLFPSFLVSVCLYFYCCILFFMTGAVSYAPARGNETLHARAHVTGEHSSHFTVKVLFPMVVNTLETDFVAFHRVPILRFPIALFTVM